MPLGTVVTDLDTGLIVADLVNKDDEVEIIKISYNNNSDYFNNTVIIPNTGLLLTYWYKTRLCLFQF